MSEDKKESSDSKVSSDTKEESKFKAMETKTSNELVITVKGEEGRVYKFSMLFHSPLPECYYAAINAANEIARLCNEAIAKQKESADSKESSEKKEDEQKKTE